MLTSQLLDSTAEIQPNTPKMTSNQSASAKHREEFLNPDFWHPKAKNFEIIDWAKFEATNPIVPKTFDPPQRYAFFRGMSFMPLWWWNRSCLFQPIALCLHSSCCAVKPEMERISGGVGGDPNTNPLFQKMLGPNPDSDKVPAPLRNQLFWTENNIAPETLISFNRWAWRSNTQEGRVIGLGPLNNDWTTDVSCFAFGFSVGVKDRFMTVQASPDGKWLALAGGADLTNADGEVTYIFMYVVQPGDVFKDVTGKVLTHVKPGDIVRLSWDPLNPYDTDPSKLEYMYFPRKVATLDEDTGVVTVNLEHYDDLLKHATHGASDKACQTCCFLCACCMTGEERFDFQVENISDRQVFAVAPVPPSGEVIDRL
jgi:hypothetical protein